MSRILWAVSRYEQTKYAIPNGKTIKPNPVLVLLNQAITATTATMTANSATVASTKLFRFLRIELENQSSNAGYEAISYMRPNNSPAPPIIATTMKTGTYQKNRMTDWRRLQSHTFTAP